MYAYGLKLCLNPDDLNLSLETYGPNLGVGHPGNLNFSFDDVQHCINELSVAEVDPQISVETSDHASRLVGKKEEKKVQRTQQRFVCR